MEDWRHVTFYLIGCHGYYLRRAWSLPLPTEFHAGLWVVLMGTAADRGVERAKHVTNPDFQKEPGRKYMSVALVYWPDGVLQNMSPRTCEFKKILCLNRVFVDVIKLTWGHFGVEWELIRRWVSLQEEENMDTDGHTRKEAGHMRMEAETGKHCHKPRSANCRSWNTQGRILLGAGGGSVAGPSDMLIQENKFLLF